MANNRKTRTMRSTFEDVLLYESTFDFQTGTIVRAVNLPENSWSDNIFNDRDQYDRFRDSLEIGYNLVGRSPVPETVDVQITNKCGFGCPYCYQDSTPDQGHMNLDLLKVLFDGFDSSPYQVAIGGGEPTLHPDFTEILRLCREDYDVVPNYTTAGNLLNDEIAEATNKYSGGVALTFHAFKGIDWFGKRFSKWSEALNPEVQLNVHLIADKDVALNMARLLKWYWDSDIERPLNIVFLAYYPQGRGDLSGLMPKSVYESTFPKAIRTSQNGFAGLGGTNVTLAFSEGLLPYFLSRPELPVDTQFAIGGEGRFSCYMDMFGRMTRSSFEPPRQWKDEPIPTIEDEPSQVFWNKMRPHYGPGGPPCYQCAKKATCVAPSKHHMFACAYQPHNTGVRPQPLNEGGLIQQAADDYMDVMTLLREN